MKICILQSPQVFKTFWQDSLSYHVISSQLFIQLPIQSFVLFSNPLASSIVPFAKSQSPLFLSWIVIILTISQDNTKSKLKVYTIPFHYKQGYLSARFNTASQNSAVLAGVASYPKSSQVAPHNPYPSLNPIPGPPKHTQAIADQIQARPKPN